MSSVLRAVPSSDNLQSQKTCFGCGPDNPQGLRLQFRLDAAGTATASLVPGPQWEGLRGIIHGGIVATLMDEAMARSVAASGCPSVTAEMRVRFRRSAKTGESLEVSGWIVKRKRRLIEAEASLKAADGNERAHAWGIFLPREFESCAESCEKDLLREAIQACTNKEKVMNIAVPTNDGISISEHFGRSAAFLVFNVENGKIQSRELRTNGQKHSHDRGECGHHSSEATHHSHAGILSALEGCELVICAGMGLRAAEALEGQGTQVVIAAPAPAEETVNAYLAGTLPSASEGFCHCQH
jgi:predicted Fe-Mo cluster-binding NifX family protein/acyl-coenzyme A thioesterase PaaI-like protein